MPMKTTHPILAASIALLAVSAPRAEAVDRIWNPVTGVGWATGANWSGGIAPNNASDIAVFDSNFSNPSVSGIVHPGGIRYDSTASASYINGGTIGLYSAGITHNDNSTQVINSGVFLYANQTWGGAGSGELQLAGNVFAQGAFALQINHATRFTASANVSIAVANSSLAVNAPVAVDGGYMYVGGNYGLSFGIGGYLTVQNGGTVTVASNSNVILGSTLSVTGMNSLVSAQSPSVYGNLLIGNHGRLNETAGGNNALAIDFNGSLGVSDGGVVNAADAITFGASPFSNNSISVTGAGSEVTTTQTGCSMAFGTGSFVSVLVADGGLMAFGGLNMANATDASEANVTLTGGSAFNVSGTLNVATNGGVFGGNQATISASGVGSAVSAGVLVVGGSNKGVGVVTVQSGASLTATTATIGKNGTVTMGAESVGTLGVLTVNGGTFNTDGGTTAASTSIAVTTNGAAPGTVNIRDGILNTALLTIGTGSVVNLDGGRLEITGSLTNSGTFNFAAGALQVPNFVLGSTGIYGSSTTLGASRALIVTGTTTISPFRTLTLDGGTFSTGVLNNAGTLDFRRGTLEITGGSLSIGTGGPLGKQVSLGSGQYLKVSSGLVVENGGQLFLTGTATAGEGSSVAGGGRVVLQNGTGELAGNSSLTNNGLITGDGTVSKPVTNAATGQLRAEAGKTLVFTGAMGANAGTFSLQGGTLEFTTAITNGATGFIAGRGALRTAGLTNEGVLAFSGGTMDVFGDVTNASGARIVTSGAGSVTTFYDDVVHNGLEIFTGAGASTVFFGDQSGAGNFTGTGTVYYVGDLRPGNSPAAVSYAGDLVFGGASKLVLELGGLAEGAQYDHVSVDGTLAEDGTLDVVLYGGFTPGVGDTFDLIDAGAVTGSFDAVNLPALGGGLGWDTSQFASKGTVSVVPEPATGALLLGGLVLLGIRRRVRR